MFNNPIVRGIIAAAIGGAIASITAVTVDSGDIKGSLIKLGTVALAGAATAVYHLFLDKPKAS